MARNIAVDNLTVLLEQIAVTRRLRTWINDVDAVWLQGWWVITGACRACVFFPFCVSSASSFFFSFLHLFVACLSLVCLLSCCVSMADGRSKSQRASQRANHPSRHGCVSAKTKGVKGKERRAGRSGLVTRRSDASQYSVFVHTRTEYGIQGECSRARHITTY